MEEIAMKRLLGMVLTVSLLTGLVFSALPVLISGQINSLDHPSDFISSDTIIATKDNMIAAAEVEAFPLNKQRVIDADFYATDASLSADGKSLFLSDKYDQKLYMVDLEDGNIRSLDFDLMPESLAMNPQGDALYVALLTREHDDYWFDPQEGYIAQIDPETGTLVRQFKIDEDPCDMVVTSDNYLYVAPGSGQNDEIKSWNLVTTNAAGRSYQVVSALSYIKLHPNENSIYEFNPVIINAYMKKYAISAGSISQYFYINDQDYPHGDLEISPDGTKIFTSSGHIFRSTDDPATDMRHIGSLGNSWSGLAFDEANNVFTLDDASAGNNSFLREWDYDTCEQLGAEQLEGKGRFLFYNNGSLVAVTDDGEYSSRSRIYIIQAGNPNNAYDLTISTAGNGTTVPGPGTHSCHEGDVINISAVPLPGWSFSGWNGDLSGKANPASITMDGNKTITAQFTPGPPTPGRIVFTSYRDGDYPEIYIMEADGSNQTRLTMGNNTPDGDNNFQGALSSDGTRIAFVSDRYENAPHIYRMNSDGSHLIRLTEGDHSDFYPAWSSDGTRLAFVSGHDSSWQIYIMNADGSNQTQLTTNGGIRAAWSPDDTQLVFVNYSGIYTINADGTDEKSILTGGGTVGLSWSPVNNEIVFDRGSGIWLMNPDGSNLRSIPPNGILQNAFCPVWSYDGTGVAFSTTVYGSKEIYTVNMDGSGVVQLTDTDNVPGHNTGNGDPSWGGGSVSFPVMEPVTEPQGHYFNTAPVFSRLGFSAENGLDAVSYQINSFNPAGWVDLAADVTGLSWNLTDWSVPGFTGLSEGSHTLYFKAIDDKGIEKGKSGEWNWQFYKDTIAPDNLSSIYSTSHTWNVRSSDPTVDIVWTDAADGVSGLDGYSLVWDNEPYTTPDETIDIEKNVLKTTSFELVEGKKYYFHIRAVDNAGNWQDPNYGGVHSSTDKLLQHVGPFIYDPAAKQPRIETRVVYGTSKDTVKVYAELNSLGGAGSVEVCFEWGTSLEYGNITSRQVITEVTSAHQITAEITGLSAGQTYHVRAKAAGQGTYYGNDLAFCLEPGIITRPASSITTTSARLGFSIINRGTRDYCTQSFEYGLTTDYGNVTPDWICPVMLPGMHEFPEPEIDEYIYRVEITGLTPGTTYHYRSKIVGYGTAFGEDMTFTTFSGVPVPPVISNTSAGLISATEAVLSADITDLGTASGVDVSFEYWMVPDQHNFGIRETSVKTITAPGTASTERWDMHNLYPGQEYHYRAKAAGDGVTYGPEQVFSTLSKKIPPVLIIGPAGDITDNSAVLNANLISLGTSKSLYISFSCTSDTNLSNYSETKDIKMAESEPVSLTFGADTNNIEMREPGPVSARRSHLSPDTTYHYRAITFCDVDFFTEYGTFRTLPAVPLKVVTEPYADCSVTTAVLHGALTDIGSAFAGDLGFEYGTTTEYGNAVEGLPHAVLEESAFAGYLTGLTGNTVYHYRAVALDWGEAPVYGEDRTFTTDCLLTTGISGSGSVNRNPDLPGYNTGDVVRLTAVPAGGSRFTGWSGDAGGTGNPVDITMDGNKTIMATFNLTEASYGGGGGGGGGGNPVKRSITTSGLVSLSPLIIDSRGVTQGAADLQSASKDLTLSISDKTRMRDNKGGVLSVLTAQPLTDPPVPPPSHTIALAYELGPEGAAFEPPLKLTFSYGTLPTGVDTGNISIVFWSNSEWVTLPGTLDTDKGLITASISHFSRYALLIKLPPPPLIAVSGISIQPDKVSPDQAVTIQAVVSNSGGSSGSSIVVLKINGKESESREVTLAAGETKTLTFEIKEKAAGTYTVDLNGKANTFVVEIPPADVSNSKPVPDSTLIPAPAPVDIQIPSRTGVEPEVIDDPAPAAAPWAVEKKKDFPLAGILIGVVVLVIAAGAILVFFRRKRKSV
jgi:uncharacterized repeat protein (TIGR02543 family)